jgi:hypothetical protein
MIGGSIYTSQGAQLQNMLQVLAFLCLAILQPCNITGSSSNARNAPLHLLSQTEHEIWHLRLEQEQELWWQQDEEYQATLQTNQEREWQCREELEQEQCAEQEHLEQLQKKRTGGAVVADALRWLNHCYDWNPIKEVVRFSFNCPVGQS